MYVKGYDREDGTYVRPHYRSAPDGNFYNNWSTKGNINPYTGKPGTKVTPPSKPRTYGTPYHQSVPTSHIEARQLDEIDKVIKKYGKHRIQSIILENQGYLITIQYDNILRDFLGVPDPKYINKYTISNDLRRMGMSVKKLEQLLTEKKSQIRESVPVVRGEPLEPTEVQPEDVFATVPVRGYRRKGIPVRPYKRAPPDSKKWNNYGPSRSDSELMNPHRRDNDKYGIPNHLDHDDDNDGIPDDNDPTQYGR